MRGRIVVGLAGLYCNSRAARYNITFKAPAGVDARRSSLLATHSAKGFRGKKSYIINVIDGHWHFYSALRPERASERAGSESGLGVKE